jgi:hypothetical protein
MCVFFASSWHHLSLIVIVHVLIGMNIGAGKHDFEATITDMARVNEEILDAETNIGSASMTQVERLNELGTDIAMTIDKLTRATRKRIRYRDYRLVPRLYRHRTVFIKAIERDLYRNEGFTRWRFVTRDGRRYAMDTGPGIRTSTDDAAKKNFLKYVFWSPECHFNCSPYTQETVVTVLMIKNRLKNTLLPQLSNQMMYMILGMLFSHDIED